MLNVLSSISLVRCFTSFDVENELLASKHDKFQSFVYGREVCPNTSYIYLQGFVAFKNSTKRSTICNYIPGVHVEKMHGTME